LTLTGFEKLNRRIVIPATAAIVLGAFLIATSLSHSHITGSNYTSIPTSINYLLSISNGTIQVDAHSYTFYHFSAPSGSSSAQVQGKYTMGGNGSNVRIYLLDEGNYSNWKNSQQFTAYYDGAQKTSDTLSVSVPSGKTLYLIYDNSHSTVASKVVSNKVYLLYK
jgi:hypothetical protein